MAGLAAVLKNADDFVAERRSGGTCGGGGMQHGALPCGDEREDEGGREDDTAHVGETQHHTPQAIPIVYYASLRAPPSYAILPSTIVSTLFCVG